MVRASSLPSISTWSHAATYQQFFRNIATSSSRGVYRETFSLRPPDHEGRLPPAGTFGYRFLRACTSSGRVQAALSAATIPMTVANSFTQPSSHGAGAGSVELNKEITTRTAKTTRMTRICAKSDMLPPPVELLPDQPTPIRIGSLIRPSGFRPG